MSPIASTPAGTFDLDASDFPDRDSLISFLAVRCGWKSPEIARGMGMADRHARRIARETPAWRPAPRREDEPLTQAEIECMARDYQTDPYIRPEDREFAQAWITSQRQAGGVEARGN